MSRTTDVADLLAAAVAGVGGTERPGQVRMAQAVQRAVETDEHLLVQAGTGTGKSLAYLVPAVVHAFRTGKPVIVATATLALQAQIVDRDMPRLAEALAERLGRRPTYALVKGRRNYVCRHKIDGGFPDDDEEALLDVGTVDAAAESARGSSPVGAGAENVVEKTDAPCGAEAEAVLPGEVVRAAVASGPGMGVPGAVA